MSEPAESKTPEQIEAELVEKIASFQNDPLGYVRFAYPWGEPGTDLEKFKDPESWQIELLTSIGEKLKAGDPLQAVIQEATASGHGNGKSALVAWLIDWAMSTFVDCRGVVTANTENQLKTKTWAELAKWHRLSICGHWFRLEATSLFAKDPRHQKTWRVDMVPWSEQRVEAFAGLHNQGKRVLLIFDEASAIPDKIWETAEGALTDADTQILWFVFGNPTRNTGRFKDCFGKFAHRWKKRHIDSRTVKLTNKVQLNSWVQDHGEDSDFVRVRIAGLFPMADMNSLIGEAQVRASMARVYREESFQHAPKILGVDVARQGGDRSVIFPRQGLVAFRPKIMRIHDSMLIADQVARAWDKWGADGCLVDCSGGWGWGVYDRLTQLRYRPIPVEFGGAAFNPRFANKRAEIWWEMCEWICNGGALPEDEGLVTELTAQNYWHNKKDKLQLEDKDFVRDLIGVSPDEGDALGCTFAHPVKKDQGRSQQFAITASDPRDAGRAPSGGATVESDVRLPDWMFRNR